MKSCAICGSHAFNMATEGVNQGAFCDRHYWQRKAEALEAARATPALPQGEPVAYQSRMRASWSELWTQWEYCSKGSFEDYKRVPINGDWHYEARALYEHPQALPQGVEEWLTNNYEFLQCEDTGERASFIRTDKCRAYLSGMAIAPVDSIPAALPMEPFQTIDMGSKNYKAGWNRCRLAMLAAAKENQS